jgi:hypothetical protein
LSELSGDPDLAGLVHAKVPQSGISARSGSDEPPSGGVRLDTSFQQAFALRKHFLRSHYRLIPVADFEFDSTNALSSEPGPGIPCLATASPAALPYLP